MTKERPKSIQTTLTSISQLIRRALSAKEVYDTRYRRKKKKAPYTTMPGPIDPTDDPSLY
ncbi:MAG: hypothetical protein WDZ94_05190 [Patescibacteria group bacterium]